MQVFHFVKGSESIKDIFVRKCTVCNVKKKEEEKAETKTLGGEEVSTTTADDSRSEDELVLTATSQQQNDEDCHQESALDKFLLNLNKKKTS